MQLECAPSDIRHIVTDAVEQVTPLMQARRHRLALHLPPDSTVVNGDKKRLVQVIANILNNAAKYTNEGGHIVLTTQVHEDHVLISVQDDGIGMTPELAEHAFDLFAQAERSSDRSAGGLGLGLALVQSLVKLHDGRVSCSSEGIGRGSTFTVCLPRMSDSGAADRDGAASARLAAVRTRLRVLIVDDNVDAAAMLAMLLEAGGHEVMVEHRAKAGLQRALLEKPQVCLLDIGLPEMDGNQLAEQLRAQPDTAGAVLIALTGYGQESDRIRSAAAGFDHYLVKPLDIERLNVILANIPQQRA